jgi:nucleoside-diphosphate-sugar epimerase
MTVQRSAQLEVHGDTGLDLVTGAFSYSGRAITDALLASGRGVRTITGHPDRADGRSAVEVRPLDFDDLIGLERSLEGVTTLFNTYWVRFARNHVDHALAVENSRLLFHAAARAGVQRIVHVSITNPSISSPYPYFRGKAMVERALAESNVSFAILRPAILFGGDGVLLNNIAWLLRHSPVFAIGGRGDYRIRGIHVDDLAELAMAKSMERTNSITDAVGPERPTFIELVHQLRSAVGSRSAVIQVPGRLALWCAGVLGAILRDVVLTADEYHAMAAGLADVRGPATGGIALSSWVEDHAATLGVAYANELTRHFV